MLSFWGFVCLCRICWQNTTTVNFRPANDRWVIVYVSFFIFYAAGAITNGVRVVSFPEKAMNRLSILTLRAALVWAACSFVLIASDPTARVWAQTVRPTPEAKPVLKPGPTRTITTRSAAANKKELGPKWPQPAAGETEMPTAAQISES